MKLFTLFIALLLWVWGGAARAESCNPRANPHSFACQDETFRGRIFPMRDMSGAAVAGRWRVFTYSDISRNQGNEFEALVNPRNPRIPAGVRNRTDGSMVGPLDWRIGNIRFMGWGSREQTLLEVQGRTKITDRITIQTILRGDHRSEAFLCRVFIRNKSDHLLCQRQVRVGDKFVVRGYLGLLRAR